MNEAHPEETQSGEGTASVPFHISEQSAGALGDVSRGSGRVQGGCSPGPPGRPCLMCVPRAGSGWVALSKGGGEVVLRSLEGPSHTLHALSCHAVNDCFASRRRPMLQEAGWVGTAETSWRWESSTGGQP